MNPTQMQNGGQMGRGMPPNMAQMQQNHQNPQNNMLRHILQQLQSQGTYQGWQSSVTLQQRAEKVKLLIDSLRLLQPAIALPNVIQVALSFEQKAFIQSGSAEAYVAMCQEKLGMIRDTRANQMNIANVQGQQGQNNNLQQMQQMQQMQQNLGFPPQLQHQMQASPLPGQQQPQQQQHASMNVNPNMARNVNRGIPPQQGVMQQGQNMMQQPQSNDALNIKPQFTKEDNEAINRLAAQMAEKTPQEDIVKIRANLDNMSAQQREAIAQKGVDTLAFFFRSQAQKEWRRQKLAAMAAGSVDGAGMSGNPGFQGQSQNQGTQGAAVLAQKNQNTANNPPPGTSPFASNIDHFQGQQADGLRSQEAGQLVVPASNPQGMNADQFRMQQAMLLRQQQIAQQNVNQKPAQQNLTTQQQQQQSLQMQQQKMQNAQMQARSQAQGRAQAQAQAQAQARSQQQQGQTQTGLQGMPPTSAPMPMLTRGVDQQVQGGPQAGIPRPSSRAAMPAQQMPGQQQAGTPQMHPGMQPGQPRQVPSQLSQLPPQLQQLLRSQPQSEWQRIINDYRQSINMRQLQQAPQMQQATSQPGQIPRTQEGQFLGGSTIAPPMQQSLSAGPAGFPAQPQNVQQTPQQMLQQRQRQQQQHTQEMARQRQLQLQAQGQGQQQQGGPQQRQGPGMVQDAAAFQMNPQQVAFMDQQHYPVNIHKILSQNPNFPQVIRIWGELKQWLTQNPIPQLPLEKLLQIQKSSFQQYVQNQARAANNGQIPRPPNGNMLQQPQQPGQGAMPQVPPQFQGQGQGGAPPPHAMGTMPNISKAVIQRARMTNPQLRDLPEPQLIALLVAQRAKVLQQQQHGEGQGATGQPMPFMPVQPGQAQQQGPQMGRQRSGQGQAVPGQMGPTQPMPSGQRPQSVRPGPQGVQMQPQVQNKGIKRPSDDDVVEVRAPTNVQNQFQAQQGQPLGKAVPAMTRDTTISVATDKQQRYMSMRESSKPEQAKKILEGLTKNVKSSMPKLTLTRSMDAASRARITRILTSEDVKKMLMKFDQFLMHYLMINHDQAAVKQLISQRLHFVEQYKKPSIAAQTYEPNDHFSISAEYAEATVKDLLAKFRQTLELTSRRPGMPQSGPGQSQAQPLSQENLKQLQVQEQKRRESKGQKGSDVPPAPTASQPPFTIGDRRGHGTPTYGARGLKQEDLKLDPTKRRKKNPAETPASTPATNKETPAPQSSPQQVKVAKREVLAFKCAVNNCEHHMKGFPTKAELDNHTAEAHKLVEQYIADPLAYFQEETRKGLGLDEKGDVPSRTHNGPDKAPLMPKSASKISGTVNLKQDSMPVTPAAAMVRGASSTGVKATSPPSNLRKTPQFGIAKPTDGQASVTKSGINAESSGKNLWDGSPMTLDTLQGTFNDITMDGGMDFEGGSGMDIDQLMDVYMQSEAWTKTQPEINPAEDSSNESPAQNSEKSVPAANSSETSKSDEVFVNVSDLDMGDFKMDDTWVLPELGDLGMLEEGTEKPVDELEEWLNVGDVTFDDLNVSWEGEAEPWREINWDKEFAEQDAAAKA